MTRQPRDTGIARNNPEVAAFLDGHDSVTSWREINADWIEFAFLSADRRKLVTCTSLPEGVWLDEYDAPAEVRDASRVAAVAAEGGGAAGLMRAAHETTRLVTRD